MVCYRGKLIMKIGKTQLTAFNIVKVITCVIILFIIIAPFMWIFLSTFKLQRDIIRWPPTIWPKHWTAINYITVWERIPLAIYFKNTIIYAVTVAVVSSFIDSLAGYAFARLTFKHRDKIFNILLLTMLVPFQVIMIPLYIESHMLGILNTYWGLIIPRIATAYGIFFMKSFYIGLPKSLEEAGRIDGVGELGIFMRIIFPLTIPAFITNFIFSLTNGWNDLIYPLMMTNSTRMRTISAGLATFIGEGARETGPALAAAFLSMIPLILLYSFSQRYFVEGIAVSGMKE